jgi:hypothetical protein
MTANGGNRRSMRQAGHCCDLQDGGGGGGYSLENNNVHGHNTEASSRNHCCQGTAVLHITVCVSARARVGACVLGVRSLACACSRVALLIQHSMHRHIDILRLSPVLSHVKVS